MLRPAVLALFFALVACSRKDAPPAAASAAGAAPRESARATPSSGAPKPAPSVTAPKPAPTSVKVELSGDGGLPKIALGELDDVGPAGPATASPAGVVLVTRDDRVLVAAPTTSGRPPALHFPSVEAGPEELAPVGRGPSIALGQAYWVSHGRLVRRSLSGGTLEVIADDARVSCRTSAVELDGVAVVAYLGRPDDEGTSRARLWTSRGASFEITPEGAGASSVSLTKTSEHTALAVSIDGRSGMTPLHARTLSTEGGSPKLGEDVVAWVGGPAHSFTEVVAGAAGDDAWAAVPLERDATHFGLATLALGARPRMDTEASFFDYPNGIDLAPAAASTLCERLHLAFVRPSASAPHSPQELVLAEPQSGRTVTVANAAGFASVSLAPLPNGGLIAYVADGRTWARSLKCR